MHTPGPWDVQPAHQDGALFIIGSNLGGLVGAAHGWPTEIESGDYTRIEANARLIAAAPELLDTVRGLLKDHLVYHNTPEHAAARALLRKIEGAA